MGRYEYASDVFGDVGGLILVIVLLYVLVLVVTLVDYILSSYALYKIADNRKMSNSWLAWIPVACQWIVGSVVDYHDEKSGKKSVWRKVLIALDLVAIALLIIAYLVFFVSFVVNLVMLDGAETTVMEMLGILLPFYLCILVAAIVASAFSVCKMICIYKIFEYLSPSKALKYILITLLVPLGGAICLFRCKDSVIGLPEENVVLPVENVVEG